MAVYPSANQSYRYDANYKGSYTGGPAKGVLHTTETGVRPQYGNGAFAPHFTVLADPVTRKVTVWQHYDTARPARALLNADGGVQTNNDTAIQIELIGTCDARIAKARGFLFWGTAPTWALDGLAKLMRWVEATHAVPCKSTPRPWLSYPASYGNSKARMSNTEWDKFTGWCGHEHVAENLHGDPGFINIDYLLAWRPNQTTPRLMVLTVGSTLVALAAALGLTVASLTGVNPTVPSPTATLTAGSTITVPPTTPPMVKLPAPTVRSPLARPVVRRPVVRRGSTGAAVRAVQTATRTTIDGSFGRGTEAAVIRFQRAHRLTADGVVGVATWRVIDGTKKPAVAVTRPVLRRGSVGAYVKVAQRAVGATPDGAFGAQTKRAVIAFQTRRKLTADGVVGPATWRAFGN